MCKTIDFIKSNGVKEEDIDLFFDLIEKSLEGEGLKNPKCQHGIFLSLCIDYSEDKRETFKYIIGMLRKHLCNKNIEFEKMHSSNGGIVEGGDDAFYMDFSTWLIFRGVKVLDDFFKNGAEYLISYIKNLGLTNKELTYENLSYLIDEIGELEFKNIKQDVFKELFKLNNDALYEIKDAIDSILNMRGYSSLNKTSHAFLFLKNHRF